VSFVSPKTLLRRLGLKPKKAWGQHFLLHPHQGRRVVEALALTGREVVVEIGAGLGALTVFLAGAAQKVVALERDPTLARFLQEEVFQATPAVLILCQDALGFDFPELSRKSEQPLKVVGNLPYQITSPLLFKLIKERQALAQAVLMMQQEVGERLLASPGTKDYGVLSVLSQYHFSLTRLFSLTPTNFFPPPKVDSVVISLCPQAPTPAAKDEDLLSRVVKAAFATRRKTLNNTLAAQTANFGLTPDRLRAILLELTINPARRGETLSVPEFVALSNRIGDLSVGGGPGS